MFGGPNNGNAT